MKKLQKLMIVIGCIVMFVTGFKAMISTIEVVVYLKNWFKIADTLPNRFPYMMRLISFREMILCYGIIIATLGIIAVDNWIMKDDEEPRIKYSKNLQYYR